MSTEKELLAKLALLDYKQNTLTPGSGIAINNVNDTISGVTITPNLQTGTKVADIGFNGVTTDLYVPNPQVREMTQAQYDALDFNTKHNNTAYFITDVPNIKIWIGTATEYQQLTLAEKMKDDVLYCIRSEEDEDIQPVEPEEEEEP